MQVGEGEGEGCQSWEDAKRVRWLRSTQTHEGEKRIAQAMVLFRLAVVHNNLLHVEKYRVR